MNARDSIAGSQSYLRCRKEMTTLQPYLGKAKVSFAILRSALLCLRGTGEREEQPMNLTLILHQKVYITVKGLNPGESMLWFE